MAERWLPLADAAAELDISIDAARMRVKRGTLASEKRAGRVFVCLVTDQTTTQQTPNTDQTQTEHSQSQADSETKQDPNNDQTTTEQKPTTDQTALVSALQTEVEFLRAELESRREADRETRILMSQLVTRNRELELSTPADVDQSADREPDHQPSWWERLMRRR